MKTKECATIFSLILFIGVMVSAFAGNRLPNNTSNPFWGFTGLCIWQVATYSWVGNVQSFTLYNPSTLLPVEANSTNKVDLTWLIIRDEGTNTNLMLSSASALLFSAMRRHAQVYFYDYTTSRGTLNPDGSGSIDLLPEDEFLLQIDPFTY